MLHKEYYCQKEKQERLLAKPNEPKESYNGIFTRWKNPVYAGTYSAALEIRP